MNLRLILSAGAVVLASAATLISKLRNRGDAGEDEEPDSQFENEETKTATEANSPQFDSEEERESWEAHRRATSREPPVNIGDVYKLGVEEIIPHHSGSQTARGKIEGFQVFVNDPPSSVRPLDIIRVKVTSYGHNRTSAEARFMEYA